MKLTHQEYLWLSQLAYLDMGKSAEEIEPLKGKTLAEICRELNHRPEGAISRIEQLVGSRHAGGMDASEFVDVTENVMALQGGLAALTLKGYCNDNCQSGFVAFSLQAPDTGDVILAFRGTESQPEEGSGLKDWLDNFIGFMVCDSSVQFDAALAFAESERHPGAGLYVTGHSKGAANALYVAAMKHCTGGVVFNSPGIGQCLRREQRRQLRASPVVDLMTEGDPVSATLFHPEQRMLCRQRDTFKAEGGKTLGKHWRDGHYPQAFAFGEDGGALPAENRTETSVLIGRASIEVWKIVRKCCPVNMAGQRGTSAEIGDYLLQAEKFIEMIQKADHIRDSLKEGLISIRHVFQGNG